MNGDSGMPYRRLKGANGFARVGRRFWRFLRSIHHDFVCGATERIGGMGFGDRCVACGRRGV